MKRYLPFVLLLFVSCVSNENSRLDTKEIDINEARAACEKLDYEYENIYKNWFKKNNISYNQTDAGLVFEYQNGIFVITENSNDKEYFQLIMPNIGEINDNNFGDMLVAVMAINREKKCVKCFVEDGNVWLSTEILLDQTPEIEAIMPRLLSMLHGARNEFRSKIKQ